MSQIFIDYLLLAHISDDSIYLVLSGGGGEPEVQAGRCFLEFGDLSFDVFLHVSPV